MPPPPQWLRRQAGRRRPPHRLPRRRSAAPAGATATVINELGANLRPAPSRDLDGVFFAEANQSFTVVGRSGDGEWVQVVLPDGSLAWALLTTVNLSVGADSLPVTQP
jgi:uncharacterized protein YgiM (DUF1202 family)